MCVITDKSGVLGLGGIIGGTKTSTEMETKMYYLNLHIFYQSSFAKQQKN